MALASIAIELNHSGKFLKADASDVVFHLDYAMNVTTDGATLQRLAEALALIAPKLAAEAETTRAAAVRRIRVSMQSIQNAAVVATLANGWERLALAERMTHSERRGAFQQLVIKVQDPANVPARPALRQAAVAMVRSSDSSQVMQSTDQLLSALQSDLDPELLDVFLTGIRTLAALVDTGNVDQVKARIVAVTTDANHVNDQIMNGLIQALDALPGEIATPELVELLKSPVCAGESQLSLLKMIERQTKLRFEGNPWKLVAQAKEAGLDPQIFRSPAQRPKPVAPIDATE
jgi:hypothetical protein